MNNGSDSSRTPATGEDPSDSSAVTSPEPTSRWRGRGWVILAAVMWSTAGLFAKAPVFDGWPIESRGLSLAFWRAAFAAAVLATMVRRVQWTWRLAPVALLFAVMNWTYLNAMVLCEASLAIWLQYTAPLWVTLISWGWFGDRPSRPHLWLLLLVGAGLAVIFAAELQSASLAGVMWGLASGICFAGVVVCLRRNQDLDAAWMVFLNHAVTAVLFLPVVWQTGVIPQGSQWLYLAGFGALQLGIPYLLLARALKTISSHEASGLTLLEPILVPVWVWVAWGQSAGYQPPAITTMVGGGLILAGLLIRLSRDR